jgi:RHS repeat-associated protein
MRYSCSNALKRILIKSIVFIALMLPVVVQAADEEQKNFLKGTAIVPTAVLTTADPVFGTGQWSDQQAYKVSNILQFEIDFFNTANYFFYNQTFTATCSLQVKCYNDPVNPTTYITKNISLTVNYNPATGAQYKGMADVKFEGAYKVEAEVISVTPTGITTSKPVFMLTNRLIVTRQYNFNAATTDITKYFTADGKKLRISWEPTDYPGAEEFDLEYTYIDELSEAGQEIKDEQNLGNPTVSQTLLEQCFKNNSTRINLSGGVYELNLNYNQGFLLYRIRGVQYRYTDGIRLEGQWNYVAEADPLSIESSFEQGIVPVNWHLPDLNWQYNATYAEEGKRKEVISYFDGTLRSRQLVTINNADDKAVIAETVYDALGRPAMNILPTPHNSDFLEYYPSFNINASQQKPVSYKDLVEADCELTPGTLYPTTGAEKYYSSNNPFISDASKPWNNVIPRSDGYPYSVVQYTPDNTGRVRAQGGVGKQYQIGGANYNSSGMEHTTRYFYGKPGSQYELDRLFGYEAGDLNHYLKNMTVDPNGQVSVTYVNSEGKTVATALAGLVPDNLQALPGSSQPSSAVKDILLNPSSFRINNARSSLEASATFLAPTSGEYKFTYHFNADQYRYTTALSQTLCYSCSYDILITVKDECGTVLLIEEEKNVIPANTNCGPPGDQSKELSVQIPKTGEYNVYFELVVSKDVLDNYTEHYIQNNTDLKTFRQFLLEQLVEEKLEDCYSDCEACKTLPDNVQGFIPVIRAYYEKENIPFDAEEETFATTLYSLIHANCQGMNCIESPCDEMLEVLMQDVTPGGQYAEYNAGYQIVNPHINAMSWYTTLWFKDKDGNDILVENDAGEMVNPSQLPLKEFILKFEDEWAYTLVRKHPEYCYYEWCTQNNNPESKQFDNLIGNMRPEDAIAQGYYQQGNPLSLYNVDPFFQTGYGVPYQTEMTDDLQQYSTNILQYGGTTKDMCQTMDYFLYCVKAQPSVDWNGCNGSPSGCRSSYMEWQLFKQWYLELKQKYYTKALRANKPECTNCFIPVTQSGGSDPVDWSGCIAPPLSDFTVTEVPNSTADGTKRILIKYRGGNEAPMWPLSLKIELKDNSTNVTTTQELILVPGFGTQEMMVPENFEIFTLKAVACAQISTGEEDSGRPGKGLIEAEEWSCPDREDHTISVSSAVVDGTSFYEVKVCYTGPAIPGGKVINIKVRVYTDCFDEYDLDFQFCSTSPTCISKPVDTHDCPIVTGTEILEVSCADVDCVWECPNERLFITQDYQLDETHTKVTLCYNGPAIPQGTTIFLTWRINIGCKVITYPVMFCSTSPTCITKNIILEDGCSRPEMSVENIECRDGNCEWRCPEGENNFQLEWTHNPVSTAWEAKICYVGPPIPLDKVIDVWVHLGGCIVGGAVDYKVTFSHAVTCHTRTFTLDSQCGETVDFSRGRPECRQLESNPCPAARDFALSTSSTGTCNPNGLPGLPTSINVDYLGGTLVLNPPLYRVKVTVFVTVRERWTHEIFTEIRDVWFTNGTSSQNICLAYNENYEVVDMELIGIECAGPCVTGECCDDPRYGWYTGKIRRFQDYEAPDFESAAESLNSGNMDFSGYPVTMCKTECESMADEWIENLKGCTNDPVLLEQVRRKLIDVCKQSCSAQAGSATIYPYSDVNPQPSFKKVIEDAFGGILPDCSDDLINNPYPWGKAPVGNRTYATETNSDICKRFDELRNECISKGYGSSNQDLHTYLETFYSDYYDLTVEDLDDIENACKNCNGILDMPVELPLFMDGNAKPCIDCDRLHELLAEFNSKYPGITTTHPKYEVLFANFMNHNTGFSYSYSKYADFLAKCESDPEFYQNGKICELPQQMEAEINLLSQCMEEKFYNALTNATSLYTAYIEEEKRKFRDKYMAKCLGADPYLESETILYEYHYTLFYYDLNGNLVKTIPPAGVVYLDDASIASLQADRSQYIVPAHTLATVYKYNSFNQKIEQTTPDGGTSYFWYDRLARLVISQNEEQRNPVVGANANRYSYTLFDQFGRVKESGEKINGLDISNVDTKDDYSLENWMTQGNDVQITQIVYDKADLSVVTNTAITNEQDDHTSRKRIVATLFKKERYPSPDIYDAATHYKYDINGNAITVWQENTRLKEIATMTGGLKRIDYSFDLVSGKVHEIYYQKGKSDQFIYRYEYDAENRIISSESSRDSLVWQSDTRYSYYLHAPLARKELGTWRVQGVDYSYTLQGWKKHINSPGLNSDADISGDGDPGAGANFINVSRDAMAYMLHYNSKDYKPINDGSKLSLTENIPSLAGTGNNLYNGNIRGITQQLGQLDQSQSVTYSYHYDQLNRLVKMRMHQSYFNSLSDPPDLGIGNPLDEYAEDIAYDPNGNIQSYIRRGNATMQDMDDLEYHYVAGTNRLDHVSDDPAFSSNYLEDIDNQASGAYVYDRIGNMVEDNSVSGAQVKIEWTVYGKISKITKNNGIGLGSTTIEYEYDAGGNRIYKHVIGSHGGSTTFYVRDVDGNVLAVYTKGARTTDPVKWKEQHLYGSSRIGIRNIDEAIDPPALTFPGSDIYDGFYYGKTVYELANHLGNVLVTISDKKVGVELSGTGIVDYFVAEILTANDYYPFGMQMPGRHYDVGTSYRYGFNGKENDNEVNGEGNMQDYGMRIYDTRLGRFLSVDPLAPKFPFYTPYQFAADNPVLSVDIDGLESSNNKNYTEIIDPSGNKLKIPSNAKVTGHSSDPWMSHTINVKGEQKPTNDAAGSVYSFSIADKEFVAKYDGNGNFTHYGTGSGADHENYNPDEYIYGTSCTDSQLKYGGNWFNAYAYLAKGEFNANYKYFGFKSDIAFGSATWYNNTLGGVLTNSLLAVDGGGEVSLAKGGASLRLGTLDNNIGGSGSFNLFSANANMTAGILTGENGKYGAVLDANVGAYVAKGELTGSGTFLGMKVSGTIGGSVVSAHIGGNGGVYWDDKDGTLNLNLGGNIGFGVGGKADVRLSIPFRNWAKNVANGWLYLIK